MPSSWLANASSVLIFYDLAGPETQTTCNEVYALFRAVGHTGSGPNKKPVTEDLSQTLRCRPRDLLVIKNRGHRPESSLIRMLTVGQAIRRVKIIARMNAHCMTGCWLCQDHSEVCCENEFVTSIESRD